MTRKQLYREVAAYFKEAMPNAQTELHYDNPFQLLVAVILSAQCTDKRINQVTPRLFEDYPCAEAMAQASPEVIYDYIRSVSYPNNKAKHLVEMARMLWEKYGGEVPQDMKQLVELPGVGRKTANVVLSVVWGEARMAVARARFLHDTAQRRTSADQTFHGGRDSGCASLAHLARSLHLHSPASEVRQMRHLASLQSLSDQRQYEKMLNKPRFEAFFFVVWQKLSTFAIDFLK